MDICGRDTSVSRKGSSVETRCSSSRGRQSTERRRIRSVLTVCRVPFVARRLSHLSDLACASLRLPPRLRRRWRQQRPRRRGGGDDALPAEHAGAPTRGPRVARGQLTGGALRALAPPGVREAEGLELLAVLLVRRAPVLWGRRLARLVDILFGGGGGGRRGRAGGGAAAKGTLHALAERHGWVGWLCCDGRGCLRIRACAEDLGVDAAGVREVVETIVGCGRRFV